MKKAILITLLSISAVAYAQSDISDSEDIVSLSPFSVVSADDVAFRTRTIGGTMVNPTYVENGSQNLVKAPISIVKKADAVAIQFVLSNNSDKQELRNRELYNSVELVRQEIGKMPNSRVEEREIKFTGGDRKLFSFSKNSSPASLVNILVLIPISEGTRPADIVKAVRDLLSTVKLVGSTRYSDGYVGLYIKNPDQFRREILGKVFDDIKFLQSGLSSEIRIKPSGLDRKVQFRVVSESEFELWIDYGIVYSFDRERTDGALK